jgi:hypothetical protein
LHGIDCKIQGFVVVLLTLPRDIRWHDFSLSTRQKVSQGREGSWRDTKADLETKLAENRESPGSPSAFFSKNNEQRICMNTPIKNRDLTKEAPHSPRDRFGEFAILGRTVDKCRASISGKLGEYHYDCPLDNQLFSFKGINGDQFKKFVASAKSYEDVATWLQKTGTPKSTAEIKAWSDKVEAAKVKDVAAKMPPEKQKEIAESCKKAGLDFNTAPLFDWLEADDKLIQQPEAEMASR